MIPRFAATLSVLLVLLLSRSSFAQIVCTPGKGCTVQWQPPPVQWRPPTGQVQVDPGAQAQAQWQAELARRARWQAYFAWRAQIAADAQASINVRVAIDQMKLQARLTPDPYAITPPPFFAAPSDARVSFPRADLGLLGFCFGAYSGPGTPTYFGYCPAFRYRFNRRWALAFDPAVVSSQYNERSFGMVGLRPGLQVSFAQGTRGSTASNAYVIAGLDAWFPFSSTDNTPSVFLGGHVGVGAMISTGRIGIGVETRGLVRGGVGNGSDALAHEMSSVRLGFEARAPVLYLSFP